MTAPTVVGIAGNLQRPSKTSVLVAESVAAVRQRLGGASAVFDILDAGPEIGAIRSPAEVFGPAANVVRSIEEADCLVVGTPVYKGSYTGLFKHLFDLVHPEALAGKPVVLTATGGSSLHGLIVEHQLRPLFGFFGAHTAPTAIYATDADFRDYRLVGPAIAERILRAAREAAALTRLASWDEDEAAIYRQVAAG